MGTCFGELQTDEVILTDEREEHIYVRHPEDYAYFCEYGTVAVENPDFVIKDNKNDGTVFMVKKLADTNVNVVVKLALSTGKMGLKNSVMTCYRIRERNLQKLMNKNSLIFQRE